LALGAGGGSRIITANIQNLWHILDHNMTACKFILVPFRRAYYSSFPVAAVAQPRFHDQLVPNVMAFEYEYDNSTVSFLRSLGHNITWVAPGASYGQVIRRRSDGTFEPAADPRLANSGGFTI